jgi:V/A-type H+-transporting ATPase subunit A
MSTTVPGDPPVDVPAPEVVEDDRVGVVTRVAGPLVEAAGVAAVATRFAAVEVGPQRLPGEVVGIDGDRVTLQLYEEPRGLGPGAPVRVGARPLSARLGPGLLGSVFDGLLRPLAGAPDRLAPGRPPPTPTRWTFAPAVARGASLDPGAILGTATATATDGDGDGDGRAVVLPPGVSGTVEWCAEAGERGEDDVVAVVDGTEVALVHSWPVRTPRPFRRRLDAAEPLVTGQRVLDLLEPVAKGGTAAVVGGFGTGKTVLLQQIAKWCDADVIVYVGCGERGN